MAQADRVYITPPLSTSASDQPTFPPRIPTSQERGDELLQRWRLARAACVPAERRLDREDRR
jgi:hypothetical protein